jgi:hypothetical protein
VRSLSTIAGGISELRAFRAHESGPVPAVVGTGVGRST